MADGCEHLRTNIGGEGGIRTHGADNRTTVFETASDNGVPRLNDRMIKVQTTLVAGPGFGPIFGVARSGSVFGIGGFESPQPPTVDRPKPWLWAVDPYGQVGRKDSKSQPDLRGA